MICWLKEFLSNRYFFVRVNNFLTKKVLIFFLKIYRRQFGAILNLLTNIILFYFYTFLKEKETK
jgi:hypothetical protein